MEKIDVIKWLLGSGYGSGDASGSGYDLGSGYGRGDASGYSFGCGSGDGSGYSFGCGSGTGSGYSFGCGSGTGDGSGYGSGDASGSGYTGYGSGYTDYGTVDGSGRDIDVDDDVDNDSGDATKIISHNSNPVFYVDDIPTVILQIHGDYAKGYSVNAEDYSAANCYVARDRDSGLFAHGETLREAVQSLQEKVFDELSDEERIAAFVKTFANGKKYKGQAFFDWHNKLTGSCLFGRNQFVKQKGLSLDDEFTVREFISLCENDYGGEIIKKLKTYYQ